MQAKQLTPNYISVKLTGNRRCLKDKEDTIIKIKHNVKEVCVLLVHMTDMLQCTAEKSTVYMSCLLNHNALNKQCKGKKRIIVFNITVKRRR